MSATSFTLQATCLLLGAECAKRAWGGGNQRDGGRGGGVWVGVKHLSAFCALTDVPLSYQSTLQACDRSSSAPLTADTKCIQCKVLDG